MVATNLVSRAALKADCPRKDLYEAVQTVGHAVSGRSSLPILRNILIQAEENGLRLVATDFELGISCRINASIEDFGALTVPSKTLAEVLANLPDKADVAISVDKSHTVRIHCKRSDYKILGLPAEEYPKLPDVADSASFSIPQTRMKEMIRHTLFGVSTDETRAILTGILMVFDGESVKFVATDTHRLAYISSGVMNGLGAQNSIVPARAMNELIRLLTDADGDVIVTLSANQVRFELPGPEGIQIISRLIEGQFPNYQRVIPMSYLKRLKIPVQPLLRAVRRASIVARENSNRVILRSADDRLILTAESLTVGNAYEEVEISQEGDDVEIAFNSRYLLDVLTVLDAESVYMELTEALKPGVLRPVPAQQTDEEDAETEKPDYLCVLMPMQIM